MTASPPFPLPIRAAPRNRASRRWPTPATTAAVAFTLAVLGLSPSASAYLDPLGQNASAHLSLLEPPSTPLRLAEVWRPPTPTHWISPQASLRGDDPPALGQVFERVFSALHLDIPDDSSVGVTSEKVVDGVSGVITSVQVQLHLAARGDQPMFNGDYQVTLSHDSGYAVLLNRSGRRDGFSAGYGDSGFEVTLSDTATADIHTYRLEATGSHTTPLSLTDDPAALTGTWQPDGRSTDPSQVLTTSPRDALLDSFNGLDPNGVWILHLSDLNANGLGQLVGWSLHLTTVPEPAHTVLGVSLGLGLLALARSRYPRRS